MVHWLQSVNKKLELWDLCSDGNVVVNFSWVCPRSRIAFRVLPVQLLLFSSICAVILTTRSLQCFGKLRPLTRLPLSLPMDYFLCRDFFLEVKKSISLEGKSASKCIRIDPIKRNELLQQWNNLFVKSVARKTLNGNSNCSQFHHNRKPSCDSSSELSPQSTNANSHFDVLQLKNKVF